VKDDNPLLDGLFKELSAIAADSQDNVYAADRQLGRIQKFTRDGAFVLKWGGSFSDIQGIAVDGADNVYIADAGSDYHVKKFSSSGTLIAQWGSRGASPGQSDYLSGIAVDAQGNVYTVDRSNSVAFTVSKFSSSGTFLLGWGRIGTGPGEFAHPSGLAPGIAVDKAGNVYVLDAGNQRVQKFTSQGVFLGEKFIGSQENPMTFKGIATDSTDTIYVLGDRTVIFTLQ